MPKNFGKGTDWNLCLVNRDGKERNNTTLSSYIWKKRSWNITKYGNRWLYLTIAKTTSFSFLFLFYFNVKTKFYRSSGERTLETTEARGRLAYLFTKQLPECKPSLQLSWFSFKQIADVWVQFWLIGSINSEMCIQPVSCLYFPQEGTK